MSKGEAVSYIAFGVVFLAVGVLLTINPRQVRIRYLQAPETLFRKITRDKRGPRASYAISDNPLYWVCIAAIGVAAIVWGAIHI
jgi:hypothetical protein